MPLQLRRIGLDIANRKHFFLQGILEYACITQLTGAIAAAATILWAHSWSTFL